MKQENEDYLLLAIAGGLVILALIATAIVVHRWIG